MEEEIVQPEWRPGATRPIYGLSLHSRIAVVGNRRVVIHEITDTQLFTYRWAAIGGLMAIAGFFALALAAMSQVCR